MATIPHHHHHHHSTTHLRRNLRHSLDYSTLPSYTTTSSSSLSTTITHHPSFPLSTTTSTTTTSTAASTAATSSSTTTNTLDTLEQHLAAQNFRQADEETRRLLILLAGDAAVTRGYVFFSEVQFIPKQDLQSIDELWNKYSDGRFGYSTQRKIWLKCNKDFTRFFIKVGWMKKLDTEIEQYNYRSFPSEFIWELNSSELNNADDSNSNSNSSSSKVVLPPEGHLPLTNALRGTQLLNCILTHPAFVDGEEKQEEVDEEEGQDGQNGGGVVEVEKKKSRLASLRDKLFKPNYSF